MCVFDSFVAMVAGFFVLTLAEIKYNALEDNFFEAGELETY